MIFFTAKDGSSAEITGDQKAVRAIERVFRKAGVKFNRDVETWDEGFYERKRKSQLGEP